MKRIFVADAIGRSPDSSEFRKLLSSSYKYGLTTGTEKAEYVELTSLGRAVTKPRTPEERSRALQQAALKPDLFKRVYEHYREAKLPTGDFFHNVLEREFSVPREHVEECAQLLIENGKLTSIVQEVAGAPRVVFIEPSAAARTDETPTPIQEEGFAGSGPEAPRREPEPEAKQIFVGHGKNRRPVDQLKRILDQFKVPYILAVDEPHAGRPISAKVAELMRKCTSAIFVFTGDEEITSSEGAPALRPSDNVVYELGAASALYGNRIVIFKESGVSFASDFSDLGYITFEKDNIEAKAMDLLRELVSFGFLKVTPA